jgi:hypothetical protein
MPDRARDLDTEPASRMNQAPAAGAPQRRSEQKGRTERVRGERPDTPPEDEALKASNPAFGIDDSGAYAGRPDQGVQHTTGPGAGGATQWGKGVKDHPSRRTGRPGGG